MIELLSSFQLPGLGQPETLLDSSRVHLGLSLSVLDLAAPAPTLASFRVLHFTATVGAAPLPSHVHWPGNSLLLQPSKLATLAGVFAEAVLAHLHVDRLEQQRKQRVRIRGWSW